MKKIKIFTVEEYYLLPSLFFETFKDTSVRTTWISIGFWNKTISVYFRNEKREHRKITNKDRYDPYGITSNILQNRSPRRTPKRTPRAKEETQDLTYRTLMVGYC